MKTPTVRLAAVCRLPFPRRLLPGGTIAMACCLLLASNARGTAVTMGPDFAFGRSTAPLGSAPWVAAPLDDHGSSDSFTLDLLATNLGGSENVTDSYLNIDSSTHVASQDCLALTRAGSFDTPLFSPSEDALHADGDVPFSFAIESGASPFDIGDAIENTITSIANLRVPSFNILSSTEGGRGPHVVAGQSQDVGGGVSVWVTALEGATVASRQGGGPASAPTPSALVLLGMGGLGLAVGFWCRKAIFAQPRSRPSEARQWFSAARL